MKVYRFVPNEITFIARVISLIEMSMNRILITTLLCINTLYASTLVIPAGGQIVGEVEHSYAEVDETIDDVGLRFNLGHSEMVHANPHISPRFSIPTNTPVVIPAQFILPETAKKGIVINLAEYRLYYYPAHENVVMTFPIGIGRKGWETPLGFTKVSSKAVNPTWTPSAKLRAAAEERGAPIPEIFPAGADNPLGKHVLRLGWPSYLIHGTNRADGVGTRVSAGCIRMLPDDIEELFHLVPVGTSVHIINEPVKIAHYNGRLVMQVHPVMSDLKNNQLREIINRKVQKCNISKAGKKLIEQEIIHPSGLIRIIG